MAAFDSGAFREDTAFSSDAFAFGFTPPVPEILRAAGREYRARLRQIVEDLNAEDFEIVAVLLNIISK